MSKYRSGRINEEIKKYVSSIIQNKLKDPRVSSMISVTRVEVTRDLSYAKIFVSIFGDEKAKHDSLDALKSSAGFIRSELGRSVRLRHVPQILIEIDDSLEHGMYMDALFRKIDKSTEDND